MDAFTAAVLGGGNVLGGIVSTEMQDKNNEERSRDAFERQVYLRSTAHQATVADLRAAGLNPVLSATRGANPAPSVAMASGSSGDWDMGTKAYSAYQSGEVAKSQDMLMRSQIEKVGQETTTSAYQAKLLSAQAEVARIQALRDAQTLPDDVKQKAVNVILTTAQSELAGAQSVASGASARQMEASTANIQQELELLQERAKALRTEGRIDDSMFGEVMRIINRAVQSIRGSVPVPGR